MTWDTKTETTASVHTKASLKQVTCCNAVWKWILYMLGLSLPKPILCSRQVSRLGRCFYHLSWGIRLRLSQQWDIVGLGYDQMAPHDWSLAAKASPNRDLCIPQCNNQIMGNLPYNQSCVRRTDNSLAMSCHLVGSAFKSFHICTNQVSQLWLEDL